MSGGIVPDILQNAPGLTMRVESIETSEIGRQVKGCRTTDTDTFKTDAMLQSPNSYPISQNSECYSVIIKVRKEFPKHIIGAKGKNVKSLMEKYKVEIDIRSSSLNTCKVTVQGQNETEVLAAVDDIKQLIESLEHQSKRNIRFLEGEMANIKDFLDELISRKPTVKLYLDDDQLNFVGPFDDVQYLVDELNKTLHRKREGRTIPVNTPQGLAIGQSRRRSVLNTLKRPFNDKVSVSFDWSIPALKLEGIENEEVERAHERIVDELSKYNDFCALDVKIEDSNMGKFIGKDGRNIKSLESLYHELEIKIHRRPKRTSSKNERNVTILGHQNDVDDVFAKIQHHYCAEKISEYNTPERDPCKVVSTPPSLNVEISRLHRQTSSFCDDSSSEYGSMISEDVESCLSDDFSFMEKPTRVGLFYQLISNDPNIVIFIQNSAKYSQQLRELFSDVSVSFKDSTVTVIGETLEDSSSWCYRVSEELDHFFRRFKSCEVHFPDGIDLANFERDEADLVVRWKRGHFTALVYGVRVKVDVTVEKLEMFKKRLLDVSDRFPGSKNTLRKLINSPESATKAFIDSEVSNIYSVEVVEDDIVRQDVDLIVNTTDKLFSFHGPLSTYVFDQAGISRDCVTVIHEEIRCSPPGILKCKNIFHVAIPNFNESMEDLVVEILKQADKMEFNSIAVPVIGAGHGGWDGKDVCTAIQNALVTFARESSKLKLIRVVLHHLMPEDEKQHFYDNLVITNSGTLLPHVTLESKLSEAISWLLSSCHFRPVCPSISKFELYVKRENERTRQHYKDMTVVPVKTDEDNPLVVADIQDLPNAEFIEYVLKYARSRAADDDQPDSTEMKIEEITEELNPGVYMDERDLENFTKNYTDFECFCEEAANLVWEEIRFAHGKITEPVMKKILLAVDCSQGVDELELRDSAVTEETLELLCSETSKTTISELSVTGEDDICNLIPVICKIMEHHSTTSLRLSEDNLTDEALLSLRDNLTKITVPNLTSLDISHNEEISNYETLTEVLNLCEISELRLLDCGVVPEQLQLLSQCLKKKLVRLDLSFNAEMGVDCFKHISRLLRKNADFLGLSECDITKEKASGFLQNLVEEQISLNVLDMSYNYDLRYSGISVVSTFATKLKLSELSLAGCNLDLDCIVTLKRNLTGHKLTRLDLSDNSPLHDECLKILGRMVEECPIKHLDLSNCALSSKQIYMFSTSLGQSKISKLNISDEQITLDSSMMDAITTVASKVTDELTLCYENVDSFLYYFKDVSQIPRIVYGYEDHHRDIDEITFVPKVKIKATCL